MCSVRDKIRQLNKGVCDFFLIGIDQIQIERLIGIAVVKQVKRNLRPFIKEHKTVIVNRKCHLHGVGDFKQVISCDDLPGCLGNQCRVNSQRSVFFGHQRRIQRLKITVLIDPVCVQRNCNRASVFECFIDCRTIEVVGIIGTRAGLIDF